MFSIRKDMIFDCIVLFPLQSSKCRTSFTCAQKIDGFKQLDRQFAQFNDYNFVFTSFAKCQPQQSWLENMRKRKKKTNKAGGGCLLANVARIHLFHNHHLVAGSLDYYPTRSLTCNHYYIKELGNLHECSLLCVGILCHSCCEIEVHVEKLNAYCTRLYHNCKNAHSSTDSIGFLQVSPKIPHRQGFRPH